MSDAMNYVGYCCAGREFEVQHDLVEAGIGAWVARTITWKRVAKRRYPDPFEEPLLPNYIFLWLDPRDFAALHGIRALSGHLLPLGPHARASVLRFRRRAEREFARADSLRRGGERPRSEFTPGDPLTVIDGPLAGRLATFRAMIERAGQVYPMIEAEMNGLCVRLDPLDVRGAT